MRAEEEGVVALDQTDRGGATAVAGSGEAAKALGRSVASSLTLSTKRLGLLKQAVPSMRKVAMLWNKEDLGITLRYQASADAAKSLGTAVLPLGVAGPDDFADAFIAMDGEQPDAILMVADALTILNRKRVFDYAAAHRLPAIYDFDFYVRDGGST